MTVWETGERGRTLPLVAVISTVPMLFEALVNTLDDIAEVRGFPARRDDTVGLLRWLRPDAIVVDNEEDAAAAADAADPAIPVVHVPLQEQGVLRVLVEGEWLDQGVAAASPELIRNIVVAGMFGRAKVGRP
jgi:hypothetical protein